MRFTFPVCTAAHCTGEIYCVQDNQMDLGSKEMTNNLENLAGGIECYADYSHCLFSDWLVEWLGRREAVIVQRGAGWVQEWAVTLTRGWHAIKLSGHSSSGLQFRLWSSICDAYTIFGDVGKIDLTASFKMWQNVLSQCASSPNSVYLSHYRCQNSSTPLSSYQSEDPPPAHWNLWIIALQLCCECYAAFVPTQSNNRIRCFPFD